MLFIALVTPSPVDMTAAFSVWHQGRAAVDGEIYNTGTQLQGLNSLQTVPQEPHKHIPEHIQEAVISATELCGHQGNSCVLLGETHRRVSPDTHLPAGRQEGLVSGPSGPSGPPGHPQRAPGPASAPATCGGRVCSPATVCGFLSISIFHGAPYSYN